MASFTEMRERSVDDKTLESGLLLEAARAQQTLAQTVLEKLHEHMRDLDDVEREAIRRTFVDELQVLGNDSRRAAEALRGLGRSVNLRVALWSVGITTVCAAIPLIEGWWLLPSRSEVAALRAKRDEL